jgi:translation initiation factor IF-1
MATHQKKHMQSRGTKELIFRDEKEGEEYAEVLKAIGDCRFECQFLNTETTQAKLAGALIKGPRKQRIVVGDFVLLTRNQSTTEKDTYYIIHKYTSDDKKKLAKNGEFAQVNTNQDGGTNVVMAGDATTKVVHDTDVTDAFIDNI